MDDYSRAIIAIIKAQQVVIGPLALEQARGISGLSIENSDIHISGDGRRVLANLVNEYAKFFGRASVEVCKNALKELKPSIIPTKLPENLH